MDNNVIVEGLRNIPSNWDNSNQVNDQGWIQGNNQINNEGGISLADCPRIIMNDEWQTNQFIKPEDLTSVHQHHFGIMKNNNGALTDDNWSVMEITEDQANKYKNQNQNWKKS